jgi:hypothetical protein
VARRGEATGRASLRQRECVSIRLLAERVLTVDPRTALDDASGTARHSPATREAAVRAFPVTAVRAAVAAIREAAVATAALERNRTSVPLNQTDP